MLCSRNIRAPILLLLVIFAFWSVHSVTVDTSTWLSWQDGTPSPMTKAEAEPLLALFTSNDTDLVTKGELARVDAVKMRGQPALFYYWPWSPGVCSGLTDQKWIKSNGLGHYASIKNEYKRLRKFKLRGGTSIDIGAHFGDSTLPIAFLSNLTIAFDPSDYTYPLLDLNARLNKLNNLNIDTYNYGVGPKDGEMKFEYKIKKSQVECNGGVAGNDFFRDHESNWVYRRVVNLVSFLSNKYGPKILETLSYIKIDTEGFDSDILSSFTNLLAGLTPMQRPVIQVEYFAYYMRATVKNNGILHPGSEKLFKAIRDLPGNYTAYCTSQCNGHHLDVGCSLDTNAIVSITIKSDGKISAVMATCTPPTDCAVKCDDLVLFPAR